VSGVQPEERVSTPMLVQRWVDVLFLHWPLDPSAVAASLPEGLTVDTYDGAAWVTLTPFKVEGMRPAFLPRSCALELHRDECADLWRGTRRA
jgi:uncharacterized protein